MPKYITQTNRTILFEEFSHSSNTDEFGIPKNDIPRLDFILRNDMNQNHNSVKSMLTVKSFDEFITKFKPKYYEYISIDEDGKTPVFKYDIEPKGNQFTVHNLEDQPFYKTIMRIYNEKSSSGENNYEFDYSTLTQIMYSPEKAMKDAVDIRDRLAYNFNEYYKLEQRGASPDELSEYGAEIKRLRRIIRDDYMSKSNMNILPLAIAKTKELLELNGSKESEDGGDGVKREKALPVFTEDGIKFLKETNDNNDNYEDDSEDKNPTETVELIEKRIEKDFDNAREKGKNCLVVDGQDMASEKNNEIMKKLIVSVFAPNSYKEENSTEKLKQRLAIYQQMYKISQESFSRSVVSLLEKVLNVKAFFDNAGEGAELIISNCTIAQLLEKDNITLFKKFIEAEGTEISDERIWFAIIPAIYHRDFFEFPSNSVNNTFDPDDDDLDDEDNMTDSGNIINLTSLTTLNTAINILGNVKIITFFNFKGCSKTSFRVLDAEMVKAYKKTLSIIKYPDYAIFCYPNFEILPIMQSSVEIGKNEFGNKEYIKLPSVYIDSSYVAAALYVKSQNNDILQSAGFKVDPALGQPVRFDFEIGFDTTYNKKVPLSQVFSTNISRELVLTWSDKLKDEINKDGGFGFCFCSDERWLSYNNTTRKQDKIYVYRARTLKIEDKSKRSRPIFKTLVQVYFEKISQKTTSDQMAKFVDQISKASKECINHILYSKETSSIKSEESISIKNDTLTITYDKDRDSFKLKFNEESTKD